MSKASSFRSTTAPFNWIDNERVNPADTSKVFDNLEPRSGNLLAKVPISQKADVDLAVQSAKTAFKSWSQVLFILL